MDVLLQQRLTAAKETAAEAVETMAQQVMGKQRLRCRSMGLRRLGEQQALSRHMQAQGMPRRGGSPPPRPSARGSSPGSSPQALAGELVELLSHLQALQKDAQAQAEAQERERSMLLNEVERKEAERQSAMARALAAEGRTLAAAGGSRELAATYVSRRVQLSLSSSVAKDFTGGVAEYVRRRAHLSAGKGVGFSTGAVSTYVLRRARLSSKNAEEKGAVAAYVFRRVLLSSMVAQGTKGEQA